MREVVGRTPAEEIRTRGGPGRQDQVRDLIQRTLDGGYRSGVLITGVQLEKADPPPQVVDAFRRFNAEQNQNKLIREAEQYRNQILGQARGDAARLVADAKAYKSRVVAEAQGGASCRSTPNMTRPRTSPVSACSSRRLEDVLQKSNKVIIEEGKEGTGVVPYLPLPELQKRQNAPARTATGSPAVMAGLRTFIIVAVIALVIAAYSALFIVDQRQAALVTRFGEIQRVVTEPGLYVKIPVVDELIPIEKRVLNFESTDMAVQVSEMAAAISSIPSPCSASSIRSGSARRSVPRCGWPGPASRPGSTPAADLWTAQFRRRAVAGSCRHDARDPRPDPPRGAGARHRGGRCQDPAHRPDA